MMNDDFLTPPEVHDIVGLCDKTVRKMWRRGDFPQPIEWGYKKLRFRRSEVEAWMRRKSERQSAA